MRKDSPTVAASAEIIAELSRFDLVIVGVGDCGSCTTWNIQDAVNLTNAGATAVAVVSDAFMPIAKAIAASLGRADLRMIPVPHPFGTLPDADLRRLAKESIPELSSNSSTGSNN